MRPLLGAMFLVVLVSCGGDSGAVVLVELRTDLVPGVELDRVRTELLTDLPRAGVSAGSVVAELSVVEGDDFSRPVRIAELDAVAYGAYYLRVQAILGAGLVAERILAIDIRENAAFTVVLPRACRGVRCPRAGDPADAVSCVGGVCAMPECVTGREVACPARECAADSDCVPTVACATGECFDGLCVYLGDETSCATGERCHPELGCIDTSSCVPLTEICNGTDDDCDMLVDEGFDLETSAENCGACGALCGGANATSECTAGACTLRCAAGFGDCNASPIDGCETNLTVPETCGTCDTTCGGDTPYCEGGGCTSGCMSGAELCGGSCVSITSDPRNCGACGTVCTVPRNGLASCDMGTCTTSCSEGFDDCNPMADDGCETRLDTLTDCGTCRAACARPFASATCSTGACSIGTCSAGYGNCDTNDANGCETRVNTLTDCGGCGVPCTRAHATATCGSLGSMGTTPVCVLQACSSGWGNCDSTESNGCERNIGTDPNNCGGCGVRCGANETCEGSACVCGVDRNMPGAGQVCGGMQQCCPGDRCRSSGSLCP